MNRNKLLAEKAVANMTHQQVEDEILASRDLLFDAEAQSSNLEDAVALLCHLTTTLNDGLTEFENFIHTPGTSWALDLCRAFNVLLRDITKISADLKTAVDKGFERIKPVGRTVETEDSGLKAK